MLCNLSLIDYTRYCRGYRMGAFGGCRVTPNQIPETVLLYNGQPLKGKYLLTELGIVEKELLLDEEKHKVLSASYCSLDRSTLEVSFSWEVSYA